MGQHLTITVDQVHGLRTPNEGINQRDLKIWANVADKICRLIIQIIAKYNSSKMYLIL